MTRPILPVLVVALIGLAGCQGAGSPAASDAASASATATSSASAASSESAAASASVPQEPLPSGDAAAFSCDLPVVKPATEPPNINIVDVRVGTHDGFDRVVFEFDSGTPEFTLDHAIPPFTHDASGAPMEVEGDAFLVLVMRGGTAMTDEGGSSYDGPLDFDPAMPRLVDLIQGGDFEAQSTWYLGLTGAACTRVFTLSDPDRLVIDVEH
jgi:hypothetical protein